MLGLRPQSVKSWTLLIQRLNLRPFNNLSFQETKILLGGKKETLINIFKLAS